jgi:hypothetical protein
MTPQEKADELHVGYWRLTNDSRVARQCALVAVDEISNVVNDIWMDSFTVGESDNKFYNYWQDVKSEIEKI